MPDSGVSASESARAWRCVMPLQCANPTTATVLPSARAASSASAIRPPAATASSDQVAPTMTNSISTSTPPAVPKWRGQTHGRSLALRNSTPAISGTSSVDRLNIRANVSASRISPSSSSAEFSSRGSSRRDTRPTSRVSSAASSTDPANVYSGCEIACIQLPARSMCSQPVTSLYASTASRVFRAVSVIIRSVTWPAALNSLATRPTTAAEPETPSVAQASATLKSSPNQRNTTKTAAKPSKPSAALVSSSAGLARNQRRLTRLPSSNNSRPRPRSMISRAVPDKASAASPRPRTASSMPAAL